MRIRICGGTFHSGVWLDVRPAEAAKNYSVSPKTEAQAVAGALLARAARRRDDRDLLMRDSFCSTARMSSAMRAVSPVVARALLHALSALPRNGIYRARLDSARRCAALDDLRIRGS